MKRLISIFMALAIVCTPLLLACPASASSWHRYSVYVYLDGVPIAYCSNVVSYDSINDVYISGYEIRSSTDYVFYCSYSESAYRLELRPVDGASIPDQYLDGSWSFSPEIVDCLSLGDSPVDCIFNASVEVSELSKSRCYSSDILIFLDSLRGQINVATVVSALALAAGVSVGLVFMWWGLRKAVDALLRAFRGRKTQL